MRCTLVFITGGEPEDSSLPFRAVLKLIITNLEGKETGKLRV